MSTISVLPYTFYLRGEESRLWMTSPRRGVGKRILDLNKGYLIELLEYVGATAPFVKKMVEQGVLPSNQDLAIRELQSLGIDVRKYDPMAIERMYSWSYETKLELLEDLITYLQSLISKANR